MNPQKNPFFLQPQEKTESKNECEESKAKMNTHLNNKKLTLRKQKVDQFIEKRRNINIPPINFTSSNPQGVYGKLAEIIKNKLNNSQEEMNMDDQSIDQLIEAFKTKSIISDLNSFYENKSLNELKDVLIIYEFFISLNDPDSLDPSLFQSNDNLNIIGQIIRILTGDLFNDEILIQTMRVVNQIAFLKIPVITKFFSFSDLTLLLLNAISKISEMKNKVSVYNQLFLTLTNFILELKMENPQNLNEIFTQIRKDIYETNLLPLITEILKNYQGVMTELNEKERIVLLDNMFWFVNFLEEKLNILEINEYKNQIEAFLSSASDFLFLYSNSQEFNEGQSVDNLRDLLDILVTASFNDYNTFYLIQTNIFMKLSKLMEALFQNKNLKRVKIILNKNCFEKFICLFENLFAADDLSINAFFVESIPTIFLEILKRYKVANQSFPGIQSKILSCLSNFAAIRENNFTKAFFMDKNVIQIILQNYSSLSNLESCLDLIRNIFMVHEAETIDVLIEYNFWKVIMDAIQENHLKKRALEILTEILSNARRVNRIQKIVENINSLGLIDILNNISLNPHSDELHEDLNKVKILWNELYQEY
ncbi:MAG: hypothetical protein MJ252_27915 [archaeon]|nr:hypothetical protein [archaeon]